MKFVISVTPDIFYQMKTCACMIMIWCAESRVDSVSTGEQVVPGCTAYNHKISPVFHPVTTVGHMPIIPAPATEYDTIWTVILQCQGILHFLEQPSTVITFGEGYYCKAKELALMHSEKCQDLVLRLGGFHTCINFLKITGKCYECSGLSDVLIESGIYSESTVRSILFGKENHNESVILEDLNRATSNITKAVKRGGIDKTISH